MYEDDFKLAKALFIIKMLCLFIRFNNSFFHLNKCITHVINSLSYHHELNIYALIEMHGTNIPNVYLEMMTKSTTCVQEKMINNN